MKKFALLGSGISYTLSPKVHEIIKNHTGLEYDYTVEDCSIENFDATAKRLCETLDGFNVTKPFKVAMSEHVDVVSDIVLKTNAANLILKRHHEGTELICADNTDAYGFYRALEVGRMLPSEESKVLLIGAGGAARAAALILDGHCKLTVCNRSVIRAEELIDEMKLKDATAVVTEEASGQFDLIINATTLGLGGENCLPQGITLEGVKAVMDMIYEPRETNFLAKARAAGIQYIANGMTMLAAQAIRSVELWFEKPLELETIGLILEDVYKL